MKVEINNSRKTKFTTTQKLNNILLNNQWIKEEIKGEIKKFLETNENGNTTYQNLWDVAKSVLKAQFIAINIYIKKQEKSYINNLILFCCFVLFF